jgi:hypothetical protein
MRCPSIVRPTRKNLKAGAAKLEAAMVATMNSLNGDAHGDAPMASLSRLAVLIGCCASVTVLAESPRPESPPPPTSLFVGWARADITPDRPVALAGQMRTRISDGARDPITCTALALESRAADTSLDQAVMVSCDLIAIPSQLDEAVAAAHDTITAACPGLDPAKIVLNATHTHTAPTIKGGRHALPAGTMTAEEYTSLAAERIVGAVIAAWRARAPGTMGWALGQAAVAHNRRVVSFEPATGRPAPGRTVMYGPTTTDDFDSLEGAPDTALGVVGFWTPDDRLTGLIVNVACPAQESEQLQQISADFWHETRAAIAELCGPDVFLLPQCAAAAGSVPRPLVRGAAEAEMRRRRGLTAREDIARRISAAVRDVLDIARRDADAAPVLRHAVRTVDLPQRLVTPEERDLCLAAAESAPPDRPVKRQWHLATVERFTRQQERIARGETPVVPVGVHAIRLGDVAFVTNGFELFEEYGMRIQGRSPAPLTCVVQLAGRGPGGTYLPTVRAVEGGGYSATIESTIVGPEGGRILVDESVAMLRELWPAAAGTSPSR